MILLVCYDRSNPLRYVYARLRQIVTSVWHVRVLVGASASLCCSLLLMVLGELGLVGGLKVKMILT